MFYRDFFITESVIVHIMDKDLDNSDLEIQFGWVPVFNRPGVAGAVL